MLVEIHMIQNHAPSNLNRDDTGSPKSCIFGGVRRARISSQCIKRSIRQSDHFSELLQRSGISYRTRKMPELVYKGLIERGIAEDKAMETAEAFMKLGKKEKSKDKDDKKKEKKDKKKKKLMTSQIMFLSNKEIQEIIDTLVSMLEKDSDVEIKSVKKYFKKSLQDITVDIALFGRMVTSDVFLDIDASIQVAHAISTNKIEQEFDYFTAVDDLIDPKAPDQLGAGMIGDTEYNSACYYKYFSIDTDGFLDNMKGDKETSEGLEKTLIETLEVFLRAAIFTTPTGKQNSFAAHQLPDAILVEIRDKKIPVSYANAFVKPCSAKHDKDLVESSIESFKDHVEMINEKYSLEAQKRLWFSIKDVKISGTVECQKIDDLVQGMTETVS